MLKAGMYSPWNYRPLHRYDGSGWKMLPENAREPSEERFVTHAWRKNYRRRLSRRNAALTGVTSARSSGAKTTPRSKQSYESPARSGFSLRAYFRRRGTEFDAG